jgi:hypothetical protein
MSTDSRENEMESVVFEMDYHYTFLPYCKGTKQTIFNRFFNITFKVGTICNDLIQYNKL